MADKRPESPPAGEFNDKGRTYCGYEDQEHENLDIGRYKKAISFVKPGDVCLDAASGSGYGSALIAEKASEVTGLEIDDHALDFAKKHYQRDNITYKQADLTKDLDLPGNHFDTVISIETLEHITDHDTILREFHRVLKPGGTLVVSTVEHHVYSELGGLKNKFHIGEMTKKELVAAISKYFQPVEIYGQLRYIHLSPFKRLSKALWVFFLKAAGKLDIFKWRYPVARWLRLGSAVDAVNTGFSRIKDTEMEKTDFSDNNDFYQLMVVARKVQ
jgi:2-polyprenyl-3-methyl-5-hydroxy-6-metoxy-1,4-benzoquinol methylase